MKAENNNVQGHNCIIFANLTYADFAQVAVLGYRPSQA